MAKVKSIAWGSGNTKGIPMWEPECGDCTGKKTCEYKYMYRCRKCGEQVFRDESFELGEHGPQHYRCREEAVVRPLYMHEFPCRQNRKG